MTTTSPSCRICGAPRAKGATSRLCALHYAEWNRAYQRDYYRAHHPQRYRRGAPAEAVASAGKTRQYGYGERVPLGSLEMAGNLLRVEYDPDREGGFRRGAQFSLRDVRSMLSHRVFTAGTILRLGERRFRVAQARVLQFLIVD